MLLCLFIKYIYTPDMVESLTRINVLTNAVFMIRFANTCVGQTELADSLSWLESLETCGKTGKA